MPVFCVLAVAVLVLHGMGVVSLFRTPDFGYVRVGNQVTAVTAGGAAERAGFRNGDVLTAIEGVAVEDTAALGALPPAQIGAPRSYRLARNGEIIAATMVPIALPPIQILGARALTLVALLFLGAGLWIYKRVGGVLGATLAVLGLTVMVVMGNPPFRVVPAGLVPLLLWLWSTGSVLAAACFLHFCLLFPTPRPFLSRRLGSWPIGGLVIYGPTMLWGVMAALGVRGPGFWLQLAYLVVALALLIGAYRQALDPRARRALGRFLWLTTAAFIPFAGLGALSSTGVVTNPFVSQLASFSLALVPVALVWAVTALVPGSASPTAGRA